MIRLPIDHLGAQGDGVAHWTAKAEPIYVPGTAPGDTIDVDADGRVTAVHPGPNRATPPCPHFGPCGGCQLQHVADASYAHWVGDRILQALGQHGLAPGVLEPAHISPPRSRRRASLRGVVRAGAKGGLRAEIGFNRRQSHQLVDLAACPVLLPALFDLVAPLRTLLPALARPGRAVQIEVTATDSGIDAVLGLPDPPTLDQRERLADFADRHDLARLSINGPVGLEILVERRAPVLGWAGHTVILPPGGFCQATADGEKALQAAVLTATVGATSIVDLFCGMGTFAIVLAAAGMRVHGVDAAQGALAALDRTVRRDRLPLSVEHRDLFRRPLAGRDLARFDAVVLDPPRAGAKEQCQALASDGPPRIVCVSCNPSTFARDAALLCARGYGLERLWPVGQFLWSSQVELVGLFRRR